MILKLTDDKDFMMWMACNKGDSFDQGDIEVMYRGTSCHSESFIDIPGLFYGTKLNKHSFLFHKLNKHS